MVSYTIKSGLANMDFHRVAELLSKAFWCPDIQYDEVIKSANNSAFLVGAFNEKDEQIAYARAISDKVRFAYILDVFVDEEYRKQGIGQGMIRYMLESEEMKEVYQWILITRDAHEVYKKVGFSVISRPLDWMEIRKERPKDRYE